MNYPSTTEWFGTGILWWLVVNKVSIPEPTQVFHTKMNSKGKCLIHVSHRSHQMYGAEMLTLTKTFENKLGWHREQWNEVCLGFPVKDNASKLELDREWNTNVGPETWRSGDHLIVTTIGHTNMGELHQANGGDKLVVNRKGSFEIEEQRGGLHPAVDIKENSHKCRSWHSSKESCFEQVFYEHLWINWGHGTRFTALLWSL